MTSYMLPSLKPGHLPVMKPWFGLQAVSCNCSSCCINCDSDNDLHCLKKNSPTVATCSFDKHGLISIILVNSISRLLKMICMFSLLCPFTFTYFLYNLLSQVICRSATFTKFLRECGRGIWGSVYMRTYMAVHFIQVCKAAFDSDSDIGQHNISFIFCDVIVTAESTASAQEVS